MGFYKKQLMHDQERGVQSQLTLGLFVCKNCFGNPGLQDWIEKNQTDSSEYNAVPECDFCDPSHASLKVAHFDDLCEYIVKCLNQDYQDPIEELPFESREGGYQGDVFDKQDILFEVGLELPNDSDNRLLDAIVSAMSQDEWCRRNYFSLTETESLTYSWEQYVKVAKAGSVLDFMYGVSPGDREQLAPLDLLDWITEKVAEFDMVKTLPSGHKMYRVRYQPTGVKYDSADDLGPPPYYVATQPNRLNPSNTVMMYASEDSDTAQVETVSVPGVYAVGEFELMESLLILDLTSIPDEICFFDFDKGPSRDAVTFLRHFQTEVSKPLVLGAIRDIEYRPTQIVTQHFRRRLDLHGRGIGGIRFFSAQGTGGINLGLFGESVLLTDSFVKRAATYALGYDAAQIQLVNVNEIAIP